MAAKKTSTKGTKSTKTPKGKAKKNQNRFQAHVTDLPVAGITFGKGKPDAWKLIEGGLALDQKKGELYELALEELQAAKVPWSEITSHLISKDVYWPLVEKKDGSIVNMGLVKAMSIKHTRAVALNRFNSFRSSKYDDYGKPRSPKQRTPRQAAKLGNKTEGGMTVTSPSSTDPAKLPKSRINVITRDDAQASYEVLARYALNRVPKEEKEYFLGILGEIQKVLKLAPIATK